MELSACNLVKKYSERPVLNGLSLTIPSGQSIAILGPSGVGKSTLLNCFAGFLTPEGGTIQVAGRAYNQFSPGEFKELQRNYYSFIFQTRQLVPELTVYENMLLPLLLRGKTRKSARPLVEYWLNQFHLSRLQNQIAEHLSGGQAQKVAIARALSTNPAVLFADEPTNTLDQSGAQEVMQQLSCWQKQKAVTLVLVTHDPMVAAWCDRQVTLRDGLVVADSHPHSTKGIK